MNIKYDSVKSYINRHFSPSVIQLTKSNDYEVGTLLYPLDNSARTNATIIHIDPSKKLGVYRVLTDFGNVIHLSRNELVGIYEPPKYKRDLISQTPLPEYHDIDEVDECHVYYTELLTRLNRMWCSYLSMQGYEVDDEAKGWEALHPAESNAWRMVCQLAAVAFPDVDIDEVLDYAD